MKEQSKGKRQEINFTKAAIEGLQPSNDGKRAVYYDSKTPGLLVRVAASGRKTFQVYRWHNGGPVRVTIGVWPDLTIEQIRKKAAQINTELALGGNPNDTLRQQRQEMTFADLFTIYMERHSKQRKTTWREDQRYYDRHLADTLGKRKLSAITKKDISSVHSKIGKTRQVHANRVLTLISSVFGRAIEYGLWEGLNPCQGIKKFREQSRDRFLSAEELTRFFQALEMEPNDVARDYFIVSLFTGARRANVLAMRWSDVDLNAGVWRIPMTKNGTPQTVPLVPAVVELLHQRRINAKSLFVFPGSGVTGHLVEPKKAWARICTAAGLEDLRIHDLRRTCGSWQAKTGASLPVIGKSLNHQSASTTSIYARLDLDPVRSSMERAAEAMLEASRQPVREKITPIRRIANSKE